jgi:hypothetical protein
MSSSAQASEARQVLSQAALGPEDIYPYTISRPDLFLNDSRPLHESDNPIYTRNRECFLVSAGPINFDFVNCRTAAQSKMQTRIGVGAVTPATVHIPTLPHSARRNEDLSPDRIARTFGPAH